MKHSLLAKLPLGLGLILLLVGSANAQWPAVTKTAKPWTRWWWPGSAVDDKNIAASLKTYSKVGIGGVEIVPIYGAIGYEPKYIQYLSPQWMNMLDYTVKQASDLNMGVYMAVGTGWPIGGPQVSMDDAATKLIVQTYTLKAGEPLKDKIIVKDPKQKDVAKLSALIAYDAAGKTTAITEKVQQDGTLQWQPANGEYQLYAAFIGKTKQQVKRAAPGGEGYTLDHFSKNSLTNYFKKFDDSFGKTSHGVAAFYNDSYEVYGADWTPDFFDEFKKRRGYDLKRYLRELSSNQITDTVARIKSDYRETIADLMLQNFSHTYTNWAHSKNALSLNQAHGSPGNILDMYGAVDIPETETFGSTYFPITGLRRDSADIRNVDPDPYMLKFASSGGHEMGRQLVSCETFTWLTEHFKTAWSQCKPEVEQVFLAGVNHVFFHGTTYSPEDAPWPGWLFYASVNFVPNNSLWPHLTGLTTYITRCQSVLQAGKPDNEIAAYWPMYDAWNKAKGMDIPLKVHDIDEWLYPTSFYKNLTKLQNKGYSIDFVSDKMLEQASVHNGKLSVSAKGAEHKVLLISACKMMPITTLQNIINLAENGATVIMQAFPEDVPGLNNIEESRKELRRIIKALNLKDKGDGISELIIGKGKLIVSNDVQKGLEYIKLQREEMADIGLKFIRRSIDGGKYYYIVNHTPKAIDQTLSLQFSAESVIILNPQTGETGAASFDKKENTTDVRVQLQSGEAVILKVLTAKENAPRLKYWQPAGKPIDINGTWKLHFTQGGPALPSDKTLPALQPWTMLSDTATQSFSGTGVYSTTFTLTDKNASDYLLQLNKVNESAKVFINGQEAGLLWSIPFQMRVGKYLKPGKNTITIEVANLAANRIRYMDRNGIVWRKYHEINFVNINYKDFSAVNWAVQPSGLTGPVQLVPLKE